MKNIEAKQNKLNKLIEKRDKLTEQITNLENDIENIEKEKKVKDYEVISSECKKNNIDVTMLIDIIKSKDFKMLEELINND